MRPSLTKLSAPGDKPPSNSQLAEIIATWRAVSNISAARAAELLGVPKRTIEGIEQERGFRYPKLLLLALSTFAPPGGK